MKGPALERFSDIKKKKMKLSCSPIFVFVLSGFRLFNSKHH
jgi:hypothetical protein